MRDNRGLFVALFVVLSSLIAGALLLMDAHPSVKLEYFCTMSPLVVGHHIITGVGGDSLDNPGYLGPDPLDKRYWLRRFSLSRSGDHIQRFEELVEIEESYEKYRNR
jgi:hypothetical protein